MNAQFTKSCKLATPDRNFAGVEELERMWGRQSFPALVCLELE
ncbi:hypothetical protein CES86_0281 [Brucella lupini]|uniref:Uncharacterized protein n=1 Tax=Brucella lupini TaxID=255457 RepID=A0A256GYK8_9HYPH|nr:hypothetical protein CES86_0281 [Brucella lupini]